LFKYFSDGNKFNIIHSSGYVVFLLHVVSRGPALIVGGFPPPSRREPAAQVGTRPEWKAAFFTLKGLPHEMDLAFDDMYG
jgi:hypothetical protein